jgi:hypothetical protein
MQALAQREAEGEEVRVEDPPPTLARRPARRPARAHAAASPARCPTLHDAQNQENMPSGLEVLEREGIKANVGGARRVLGPAARGPAPPWRR